ncbi:MAG TPA: hypothetical protein ENI05_10435 [Porticoccus sp.]|nr:hypothetical protein [Porticoccus sp.]
MPPRDCNQAKMWESAIEKAINLFWVMSFIVGGVVGAAGVLLTATLIGALAAAGVALGTGIALGLIYNKLAEMLTNVQNWIANNC